MIYLKDQHGSIPLLKDVDSEIDEINKKLDNVCFERISTKNYVVEKYTNGDFKSYGNFKITSKLDFYTDRNYEDLLRTICKWIYWHLTLPPYILLYVM